LIFFVTAVPVILIKKQPSLSASLVILAIMFTMLFVAKLSFRYIAFVMLITVPVVLILFIDIMSKTHPILSRVLDPYQLQRILNAVNLDLAGTDAANYQTRNSAWAIGSGKLFGKGIYNGTINQLSYLPESHNDFIFSVIGEEFGFVGCLAVLGLMLFIIMRCIKIASNASDGLGMLIASGVAGMFAFQTFVNVGVATGLLPNTGMPFPFLSYGGSSMWINMIAIGLVLNVGMRKQKSFFEG
jgi:rod shape determining protein RodA